MQQQRTEEKWIFIYRWNNFTMDGEIFVLFGNLRNWKKKKNLKILSKVRKFNEYSKKYWFERYKNCQV